MIPKLTAFARFRSSFVSSASILAEHLGGGHRVDVVALREGVQQELLAGQVREDAQLDLRVVGRDEPASRLAR